MRTQIKSIIAYKLQVNLLFSLSIPVSKTFFHNSRNEKVLWFLNKLDKINLKVLTKNMNLPCYELKDNKYKELVWLCDTDEK